MTATRASEESERERERERGRGRGRDGVLSTVQSQHYNIHLCRVLTRQPRSHEANDTHTMMSVAHKPFTNINSYRNTLFLTLLQTPTMTSGPNYDRPKSSLCERSTHSHRHTHTYLNISV